MTVENDMVTLKQNYSHFFQVQGQKDVPGKSRCDFFVCAHSGLYHKRITLNPEIWKNFLKKFNSFYTNI